MAPAPASGRARASGPAALRLRLAALAFVVALALAALLAPLLRSGSRGDARPTALRQASLTAVPRTARA
ncbi:MAG TPA: hypothetical protein VN817_02335, partial [Solirubrobacteraceae bacterium]|nr:hypothetical protein [Solirubrobacteraceae bacterium]